MLGFFRICFAKICFRICCFRLCSALISVVLQRYLIISDNQWQFIIIGNHSCCFIHQVQKFLVVARSSQIAVLFLALMETDQTFFTKMPVVHFFKHFWFENHLPNCLTVIFWQLSCGMSSVLYRDFYFFDQWVPYTPTKFRFVSLWSASFTPNEFRWSQYLSTNSPN